MKQNEILSKLIEQDSGVLTSIGWGTSGQSNFLTSTLSFRMLFISF